MLITVEKSLIESMEESQSASRDVLFAYELGVNSTQNVCEEQTRTNKTVSIGHDYKHV